MLNLVANGNFENDTTDWALNGAWVRSNGWAKYGSWSLAVVNPPSANESGYVKPITPGAYVFSVWVNNQMSDTCRINLAYSIDGGNTWIQDGAGLFDSTFPAGFLGRYIQTITFPAGTTHFKIRTIQDGARSGVAYMDDFAINPGSVPQGPPNDVSSHAPSDEVDAYLAGPPVRLSAPERAKLIARFKTNALDPTR